MPNCFLTGRRIITVMMSCVLAFLMALPAFSGTEEEFFETKVRPIFAQHCQGCHGETKQKGGLRLDSAEGLATGGDSGPAIVAGDPEGSLLIKAITYEEVGLQMPPKGRLADLDRAVLADWIKRGARWSKTPTTTKSSASADFNLAERKRSHWCWQPIQRYEPSDVNTKANTGSERIDAFIASKLKVIPLPLGDLADKRTRIRRLSYDLTGLPPSPEEVLAFERDESANAYEKVVDRLLSSSAFGERWGRHWLDLVRFAETLGHEFDYTIPGAYHYRDYVIRSFNEDVSYRDFIREQIAGDLLPAVAHENSRDPSVGTGFWYFAEQTHSPVDVRQHRADLVDNQIDVVGKTFLGLTISCARCHDHKFDAISTRDYYALAGVVQSSRYAQRPILSPNVAKQSADVLPSKREKLEREILLHWEKELPGLEQRILAAIGKVEDVNSRNEKLAKLMLPARDGISSRPFDPKKDTDIPISLAETKGPTRSVSRRMLPIVFESIPRPSATLFSPTMLSTAGISIRSDGAIRSKTIKLEKPFIHVRAMGQSARIRVLVEGFQIIRDPIYGSLQQTIEPGPERWFTFNVSAWKGDRAYVEVLDQQSGDLTNDASWAKNAYACVSQVVCSDSDRLENASEVETATKKAILGSPSNEVVSRIVGWSSSAIAGLKSASESALTDDINLFVFRRLLAKGLFTASAATEAADSPLAVAWREWSQAEAVLESVGYTSAITEGTGMDAHLAIRGNPRSQGDLVPRRFLEALGHTNLSLAESSTGRLALAELIAHRDNPLTARVYVNRVWKHLMGEGIVASVDNFGVLGERPSNPELLDDLALRFMDAGWSTKKLIREIVCSRVYQQSRRSPPEALLSDPNNSLFWSRRRRRLEGEEVRDAILMVSGRLDRTMYGPSIAVFLSEHMQGRGRPGFSGPLDGAGRRSIYLTVRRNFLTPLLMAFDFPIPFQTVGRRHTSNVPHQTLALLNDPFVLEQADFWSRALDASKLADPPGSLKGLLLAAFARPPAVDELKVAAEFVRDQQSIYQETGISADDAKRKAFADLFHSVVNSKEFVWLD